MLGEGGVLNEGGWRRFDTGISHQVHTPSTRRKFHLRNENPLKRACPRASSGTEGVTARTKTIRQKNREVVRQEPASYTKKRRGPIRGAGWRGLGRGWGDGGQDTPRLNGKTRGLQVGWGGKDVKWEKKDRRGWVCPESLIKKKRQQFQIVQGSGVGKFAPGGAGCSSEWK